MTNHRQLNLGCGFDKRDDFLNVDGFVGCEPDLLMDIDTTPWPLESNAFDFILMKHVLELVRASMASQRSCRRFIASCHREV